MCFLVVSPSLVQDSISVHDVICGRPLHCKPHLHCPSSFVAWLRVFSLHFSHVIAQRLPPKDMGPDATMQQDWHFWIAYLFPFITLVGAASGIAFLIHSILPSGELALDVILSFSLFISLTLSLFVLSGFGTMIPAAIAKKSVGFKAALKRSHGSYWFVFWRLLVGPALLGFVWVSMVTFLSLTELVPQIPETFSGVTVTNTFWSITAEFLGSFLGALCASIFSLAYLRAEVGPVSLVSDGLKKV